MKTIYHIVNSARMRMQLNATLQMSVVGFVILSVAILVLTIFDRVGQTAKIPWEYASIFIAFAIGLVLVRSWLNGSVSTIEAATEVDARLGLRDRLSSALSSENEAGPYCICTIPERAIKNRNYVSPCDTKSVRNNMQPFGSFFCSAIYGPVGFAQWDYC